MWNCNWCLLQFFTQLFFCSVTVQYHQFKCFLYPLTLLSGLEKNAFPQLFPENLVLFIVCNFYGLPLFLFFFAIRLVGFAPFWHRKKVLMMRAIMEGRYHFTGPEWEDVSDTAKDLVSQSVSRQCYPLWFHLTSTYMHDRECIVPPLTSHCNSETKSLRYPWQR